jgi:hypothetical protein
MSLDNSFGGYTDYSMSGIWYQLHFGTMNNRKSNQGLGPDRDHAIFTGSIEIFF